MRTVEAVQGFMFTVMFPLTFVANTFAPTESMPAWLRTIAEWNPVSAVTQACRELWGNGPPAGPDAAWPLQHPVLDVGRLVAHAHRDLRAAGGGGLPPPLPRLTCRVSRSTSASRKRRSVSRKISGCSLCTQWPAFLIGAAGSLGNSASMCGRSSGST